MSRCFRVHFASRGVRYVSLLLLDASRGMSLIVMFSDWFVIIHLFLLILIILFASRCRWFSS